MSKTLKVVSPFFTADVGDTFVLSADGKAYVNDHNEEFHASGDTDLTSSFQSTFRISTSWAKQLIEDGYLESVTNTQQEKASFVNVFDEIDTMIAKYENELKNIGETMANQPECLRVEKTTVLSNILKVLQHLKSLRK